MPEPEELRPEECQECGAKAPLNDAILDGKVMRLCKRCITLNEVIELPKPPSSTIAIPEEKRLPVRALLEKLSGLDKEKEAEKEKETGKEKIKPEEITLNDLIERHRKLKKMRAEQSVQSSQPSQPPHVQEQQQFQPRFQEQALDFSLEATKKLKIGDLLKLKAQAAPTKQEKEAQAAAPSAEFKSCKEIVEQKEEEKEEEKL